MIAKMKIHSRRRKSVRRIPHNQIPSNAEEWWLKWWDEDFTWEGLRRKRWQGWKIDPENQSLVHLQGAPEEWKYATLQDYWRTAGVVENDLIDVDGLLFTPYHCPYTDENGEQSVKDNWPQETWVSIETKLEQLARQAKETRFSGTNSDEPDERVQLQGVVLRQLPILAKPWFLCARNAYLGPNNTWRKQHFGQNCELTGAFLDGDVDLSDLQGLEIPILARSLINGSLTLLRSYELAADFALRLHTLISADGQACKSNAFLALAALYSNHGLGFRP